MKVFVVGPPLGGAGAVDALGGMRNGLQAGSLDVAAAGVALAVAAGFNSFEGLVDFGKLAAFDLGELSAKFHLFGGERGVDFVSDAGIVKIPQRAYFACQRTRERLTAADELLFERR